MPSSSWQFSIIMPIGLARVLVLVLRRSVIEWLNMVAQSSMSRWAPQPSSLYESNPKLSVALMSPVEMPHAGDGTARTSQRLGK